MAVFFNGQLLTTPTTASAVVDDAMRNQNLSVGNVLALVGKSAGGKPKSALRFGTPDQARRVLRGGELLDAVLKAFSPSNETGGPQEVIAIRVQPALQASLILKDDLDANVINLTSTGYGLGENQVKVRIEDGTLSGKRLTTQFGTAYYTADNVGRTAFKVSYTGAATVATVDVAADKVTVTADLEVTEIPLAEFATVDSLVDRINAIVDFTATVEDRSNAKPTLNALDFLVAGDVKAGALSVKADLQAAIDWINGAGEGYAHAERALNAGTPPANVPFQFMTGGTDGTTDISDWNDAFEALQTIDVQWVSPVTPDPAIHAMCDTHVHFCSGQLKRERRSIVGMESGTTDDEAIAAAKLLNSDRTSLAHIGYYDYDETGKLVLMSPYMTAALLAGAFTGVSPGTPLTNKSISVRGLERDLVNPTETDPLIRGGVLCVENTEQGYKVVQSISTWLVNDNYNRVEQSCGVALDFVVRNVRNAVDVLRGRKGGPLVLSRAISIAESTLRELAREEPQGPGVIVGDAASPAYRNITASLEGDAVRVDFECSPVIPVNYVLNTVYAVPYSGSASAA